MKIVVDVVNSEKIEKLTAEIKKQEENIRSWNAQMQTASPQWKAIFQTGMQQAAGHIVTARKEIDSLAQSSIKGGYGLMQLGYAIDDLQYGFSSIVNNIPQIAMSIGGTNAMAIAGAAGIAAVAINQLIKHWSGFADVVRSAFLTDSISQFMSLNEELKRTRERADEATAAFEKLAATPTKRKAAAGAGVSDLITEGPTEKIHKDTAEAISKDVMMKATKEDRTLGEKFAESGPMSLMIAKMLGIEAGTKAEDAKNAQKAKELLGAASQGDEDAMKKLEGLVRRHPQNFPAEFLQDVRDQTPEGQKRIEQQRLEAQGARNARKMGEEEKARLEKEKEDQNKLEIEGRKNAKQSDKDTAIKSLEDERTRVQRAQKEFDDQMWQKTHEQSRGSVMAGGAENLIKSFQMGAGGPDDPKELAKKAHEQRVKTNKLLEGIDDKLKEERRVKVF